MEINHSRPNLSWIICSQTEKQIIDNAIIYSLAQEFEQEQERVNQSTDKFNQNIVQILQKSDYLKFRPIAVSDDTLEYLAEVLCDYSLNSDHSDAFAASYLADQLYEEWDRSDQPNIIEMVVANFKIPDSLQGLTY